VEHGGVLDEHLAHAVAFDVVILHVLCWERLHPIHQRRLLDDAHRRVEVETPSRGRLEVPQVEVGVREAVLGSREHAGVHELVLRDLPLAQHAVEVHPLEHLGREVQADDDNLHAVEQEPWRPEHCLHHVVFREVRQLRPGEVWRLQALVAPVPEVVEDEVYEVAVDAAGRHGEALLRIALHALGQEGPGLLHLMLHPADEHGVLRPRGHALENEQGRDLMPLERLQFLVHKAKNPGRSPPQRVREGVLQRLDRAEPEHSVHAHLDLAQRLDPALVHQALLVQV